MPQLVPAVIGNGRMLKPESPFLISHDQSQLDLPNRGEDFSFTVLQVGFPVDYICIGPDLNPVQASTTSSPGPGVCSGVVAATSG